MKRRIYGQMSKSAATAAICLSPLQTKLRILRANIRLFATICRHLHPSGSFALRRERSNLTTFAEPNEFHFELLLSSGSLRLADMFAKWPILAERSPLRRMSTAGLTRPVAGNYANPDSALPHFSGDAFSGCFWLTKRGAHAFLLKSDPRKEPFSGG